MDLKLTDNQQIYQIITGIIILCITVYIIKDSFISSSEISAFILAFILTVATIQGNRKILISLVESPSIIYYSIILTLTMFLSVDDNCKKDKKLILLILANILISVSAFLTQSAISLILFIFMNFYLVLVFILFFLSQQ